MKCKKREGTPLSFVGFWRPPPPQTTQYLTILITEGGGRQNPTKDNDAPLSVIKIFKYCGVWGEGGGAPKSNKR